ncbi:arf-GAP with Rho-GAP domain, ANK repeat and PH domain-containing protein 2 isoform X4 [Petaurus breviceps papuanus]|uniref:arf-GAP with Rho-GAP domain, ANK repeat and PH domain-containing protein 2 isoform X4 n=1 Tax=Petaurus breviceps papuanus TaxID=3040969 RepID=UPI0036DC7740
MSSVSEVSADLKELLTNINLEQYLLRFQESGFHTVKDCAEINDSILQKIGVLPTGHRRRILKQLEMILSKLQDPVVYANVQKRKKDPVILKDEQALSSGQDTWIKLSDLCGNQSVGPESVEASTTIPGRNDICNENRRSTESVDTSSLTKQSDSPLLDTMSPRNLDCCQNVTLDIGNTENTALVTKKNVDCSEEKEQIGKAGWNLDSPAMLHNEDRGPLSSLDYSISKTSFENEPGILSARPAPSQFFEFKGEMIVNELYISSTQNLAPMRSRSKLVSRPSRSFMLRHRPVPEIPVSSKGAVSGSYARDRRIGGNSNGKTFTMQKSLEEHSSLIFPHGDTFVFKSTENSKKSLKNEFWTVEEKFKKEAGPERSLPFGQSSIYDNRMKTCEDKVEDIWIPREDKTAVALDSASESEYSTVEECFNSLRRGNSKASKSRAQKGSLDLAANRHSYPQSSFSGLVDQPTLTSNSISPYACYYGSSSKKVKSGWLDKQSPQGKRMFQKRWVKFDGFCISYYNNEKEVYSKGIIPLSAVSTIRGQGDSKFEVVTSQRTFVFRVEKEEERNDWITILLNALKSQPLASQSRSVLPEKCGYLELRGYKAKIYTVLNGSNVWLCKNEQLFIVIGNKRANDFWAGNLQKDKELHIDAPVEERKLFITQKYKEGRFRKTLLAFLTKEELNKALCAAVVKPDVLETMALLFSGADVMCATGDPVYSTPYLLAKKAGQSLQMEFLYHNKFSDFPKHDIHFESGLPQESSHSTFLCDFLYQVPSVAAKLSTEKKMIEETNKKWCVLEGGFLSYYENDKATTPNGTINMNEVICLAIHKEDFYINTGPIFTFEIYLVSERAFLFGAETAQTQRKWTQAIAKHFVPFVAENLAEAEYDLIGQLYYKDCHTLDQWKKGWFAMDKSRLHFCLQMENAEEELMYLRRLQELTISTVVQNGEKIDVLLLVERGRTLYIHGHTKLDFTVWHTAIEKAAGTDGNALQDQQLSKNDVPIIVNSCIAFVTQYGLGSKHIYQKNGDSFRISELLESFKKDARSFKLRAGKHQLEDVTGVLKSFLSDIDDALLTKELYPYWISALDTQDDKERVKKYSTFIRTLPGVNRATLAAIIEHLYRVQKCSEINQMNSHSLAMAFSSYLFQTKGQTSEEVNVIEDLINYYVEVFEVKEDQVRQMDIENSFITKWKDTQVSQAGDLLIEVYVERKEPDCSIIIRISPVMEAEELTNDILAIKNIIPAKGDIWATFEVIENEELERPLHYTENVLEQVLQWSSLAEPGTAYLVVKRFLTMDVIKHYSEKSAMESIKEGVLKFKEEPSKILSGNKFQDRYFILREGCLFLYKDIKSSKADKMLPLNSLKFYLGVKKKMKTPTSWGLTACSEKHHWYMCCDGPQTQMEWLTSVFLAQHDNDIWPPAGKERKRSITKNPKVGGLPLIPIQHEKITNQARRNIENEKTVLEKLRPPEKQEREQTEASLRERASMVAHCLERKEDKLRNRTKKHRSLNCLEDSGADILHGHHKSHKDFKILRKTEDKNSKSSLETDNKLPSKVIEELNVVLQRTRTLPKDP